MNHNLEIQKTLLKIKDLDKTEDIINELKHAINIADANNDIDWGYELRELLIRYEGLLINRPDSFPAFTWMLNTYDNNPHFFDETEILQNYMWLGSIAFCNATISYQQIQYIMDDFRRRLQKGGYSLAAYYEIVIDWYLFIGDAKEARRNLELRQKEPSDTLLSNEDRLTDICVELLDGNLDKAIALGQAQAAQNSGNSNYQLSIYNQITYYLNKARDPRTSIYFEKADAIFSEQEKHPFLIFELTLMMYYMSRFEQKKAWDYFEKYAEWEIGANDYSSFDFSLSILPLLKGEGEKKLNLSPKLAYYNPNNIYKTEDLFDFYYKKASDLAIAFDKRNKNSYFADQIKWHLED